MIKKLCLLIFIVSACATFSFPAQAIWPNRKAFPQVPLGEIEAYVEEIKSSDTFITQATGKKVWQPGERAYVVSQDDNKLILAVVEYQGMGRDMNDEMVLVFQNRMSLGSGFIRPGDLVAVFDLSTAHPIFKGRNELLIRDRGDVSSRYKPIITQGITIGETAQTLSDGDFLIDYTSHSYYGLTDNLTISTIGVANILGYPNFALKRRMWNSQFSILGVGTAFTYDARGDSANATLNFYLDSLDTRNQISHTSLSLSLARWDLKNQDAAVKVVGSRSVQTGYEFILSNWDRILVGPSYNFDLKTVGGFLSWLQIWDVYHLQIGLTSTNLTRFKFDDKDGYFPAIQMYWRF